MKNVLLKFAGLFVEKVPVDQDGNRLAPNPGPASPKASPGGTPVAALGQLPGMQPLQQAPAQQIPHQHQPGHAYEGAPGAAAPAVPTAAPPGAGTPLVAIALRAWVPQEYAAHLAPFGLHVIAAGGSVTSDQARSWGAEVLVISAECLGQDVHLLQQPQLPTVFITPQPVMIPDVPGVVQVQEPLRASDVAHAAREAVASFAAARR